MNKEPGDRLIEYLMRGKLENPTCVKLAIKDTMKFLVWKINHYPQHFRETDRQIIINRQNEEFFQLSDKACSYSKNIMNKYIELLWKIMWEINISRKEKVLFQHQAANH